MKSYTFGLALLVLVTFTSSAILKDRAAKDAKAESGTICASADH
jgi:hypothetical protein